MKCNANFRTNYAMVDGKEIHIRDYKDEHGVPVCIVHGHELIAVQGEYNRHHFRHKHSCDVSTSPLSEWHAEWQSHFKYTEVNFPLCEGQIKSRRADIVIGDFVIELQHSAITKEEVDSRNHDYRLHGKEVIWVIDGTNIQLNSSVLTLDAIWKYESFLNCNFIYIHVQDSVYKIHPSSIKSLTVHAFPVNKQTWINNVIQYVDDVPPIQHKIYLKQQGAGNGKTWGIIQMLSREDFQHYKKFIYVTKQHSARIILKEEFRIQQSILGFTNISEIENKNKKFKIDYTNSKGHNCTILIATIDSFMYAVGNKNVQSMDKFQAITQSIVEGHLEADIRGTISYAGINPKLNAETLYIIDEAQDLNTCYANAVMEIMKKTNMDVYVVGDKLQSISNELNAFTTFQQFAKCEPPQNECRRFIHPELIDFVNYMVPFEKYNLLPITPYKVCDDTTKAVHPILIKQGNNGKIDIEDTVNKIIHSMEKEVKTHGYTPENFLIVLPFVSNNSLGNMLEIAIDEFWIRTLNPSQQTDPYWKHHKVHEYYRYCIFHKSEEGTSINLDESSRATRMVSIHSSKGDGREVVFVINVTESALRVYSGIKNTLKYDSLLHVAITRMKKALYVFYEEDEIGTKINTWINKKGHTFEVSKIKISPVVKVSELCNEQINNLVTLEYQECSENSEIIDMSHHNIRYGILIEKIRELLQNEGGKRQIKVQTKRSCSIPVQTWTSWKDYNLRVQLNHGIKDKNGKWYQELSIPLLKINEGVYNQYLGFIRDHITRIKINIRNEHPLCPFEMIVLYYMNQISQRNYKSNITMMELYNIVDVYEKSYQEHHKGHKHCCCKETFSHNTNKNSFSDYLNSHYEHMCRIDSIIQKVLIMHPHTDWNVDHQLVYMDNVPNKRDSRFVLKSVCSFVGYNNTHVILCYVTPNLTELNVQSYKTQSIIDTFIVKNQRSCTDNYLKYHNKEVVVYILAVNLDEPYKINVEVDDSVIKRELSQSMYYHYSFLNKDVYSFYQTFRQKCDPKSCIQHMFTNWSELKNKTQSNVPIYVDGFMEDINKQSRKKEPSAFLTELDTTFLGKLNEELGYCIRDFLDLTD